jgi:hypothetical protein
MHALSPSPLIRQRRFMRLASLQPNNNWTQYIYGGALFGLPRPARPTDVRKAKPRKTIGSIGLLNHLGAVSTLPTSYLVPFT